MSEKMQTRAASAVAAEPDLPVTAPAVDIMDTPEAVVLTVDMPGVDEESLEVFVENGVMTVEGRAQPTAPTGAQRVLAEYGAVKYRRAFHLTDPMDPAAVEARLKQGVLRVRVGKREEGKARRIAVQAG